MRRGWGALVGAIAIAMVAGCGATPADEELAPIGEDADDVTAVSQLVGDYDQGQGRFVSLTLTQATIDGKRKNRFVASENVQCVRAPCPPVALEGSWYARGTSMSLYPEGAPAQTFKIKVAGTTLTLVDSRNVAVAELTKKPLPTNGVAEALKKHGVEKMRVEIDPAEVAAQEKASGVTTKFASAVDVALGLFLGEESGLAGWVAEQTDDDLPECKGKKGAARNACVANTGATIRVMARGESPPAEGDVKAEWILVFSDGRSDYGYYALVPKNGRGGATVYSFN